MIEVNHLVKRYGDKAAVNDISFSIGSGEIVGFLGPNGAGKSTTMNMLTGYISATEGTAKIAGIDVLEDPIAAKRKIGYLPELPPLYLDMTVDEQLEFAYDLKGMKGSKEQREAHIGAICRLVKIQDVRGRMIKNLSKGYKQRVGLAQALIGDPEVLILDEPTVGLDPKQIIEIRNLISNLGKKHTIILSSHILPEISAVCQRVLVLNKGRIVADDKPENLSKRLMGENKLAVRIEGPCQEVLSAIGQIDGVDACTLGDQISEGCWEYLIDVAQESDVRRDLFHVMAARDWPILQLKPMEMTLEEIFLQLTQDADAKAAQQNKAAPAEAPKAEAAPAAPTAPAAGESQPDQRPRLTFGPSPEEEQAQREQEAQEEAARYIPSQGDEEKGGDAQ
ncbi:MAG: ABC transporter ATP-binding protein [Eubacteriales bacterium]